MEVGEKEEALKESTELMEMYAGKIEFNIYKRTVPVKPDHNEEKMIIINHICTCDCDGSLYHRCQMCYFITVCDKT